MLYLELGYQMMIVSRLNYDGIISIDLLPERSTKLDIIKQTMACTYEDVQPNQ